MDAFHAKVIAAATGSTVTALTMTPFDVVKTRLQTQPVQPKAASCVRNMSSMARPLAADVVCVWDHGIFRTERVNGFADAVRHVWRVEGLRGLWKGAGTSLVIGVPASTSYILTYDHLLQNVLPPLIPQEPLVPLVAGILARSAITSMFSPLELVRTNLQSTPLSPHRPNTLRSVLTSVRTLVQERAQTEGVSALFAGIGPRIAKIAPACGIMIACFEGIGKLLRET
ncbi:putative mitochondrial carrier [Lyophyllum shimeji]|uniref:Mitochondrial carrier n=1 Tax=Lyophyllum shimeji TaxID=47721 RepID=A0A9P3UMD4_LYOSH|nr:putative mitochondrial carrier [Lyophyllum shimeji]